jgi:hypothetical protein
MNDLGPLSRNSMIQLDREDGPAFEREIENAPKRRRRARRRWGGRLFSLGGLLALAAGLSLGAWGDYSRHNEVMATARQEREFVPSVSVAMVEPSPDIVSVTMPGTTAAFAAENSQGDSDARFGHAGGSRRRSQSGRPGDPQSPGNSRPGQQGAAAPDRIEGERLIGAAFSPRAGMIPAASFKDEFMGEISVREHRSET